MAFRIRELLWDDWNEEHIARHNVTIPEVEDVCFGNPWELRGKGGTRAVYGQSSEGRYLFVVLGDRGDGLFYPITARDMTQTERRRFRQATGDDS
jgi:uncharacterized DUF497 family protein